jgi:hypothetical protein
LQVVPVHEGARHHVVDPLDVGEGRGLGGPVARLEGRGLELLEVQPQRLRVDAVAVADLVALAVLVHEDREDVVVRGVRRGGGGAALDPIRAGPVPDLDGEGTVRAGRRPA